MNLVEYFDVERIDITMDFDIYNIIDQSMRTSQGDDVFLFYDKNGKIKETNLEEYIYIFQ